MATTTALTVRKIDSPADFTAFMNFPWRVYQGDPNWTPPLRSMRRDTVDMKRNPAWEYMEGDYFGAWRGEQLVGTIAAFVNHRHNEFQQENIGWFGAFEVLDDPDAARALLTTAIDYVRAKGCDAIRGPQTFTTHEDVGLLIDGFEPSVMLMPYHKPYYRQLIEGMGFTSAQTMYSFYYNWEMMHENDTEERARRVAERLQKRSNITLRPINRKHLHADFALFKELYNKAWVANWGFVPMTERELDALIEGLSMIFDPDLAGFAMVNGEPVGFIIIVPDFNQVLRKAAPRPGEPEPITLIKALWHWKIRPVITGSRVPLMGIVPEHRKKGIDLVMYYSMIDVLRRKGYEWLDCGWILESNHDMVGILKSFGMAIHRTYRLYELPLKEG